MLEITGIASEEVNPFGPVHAYMYGVVPPLTVLVKIKSLEPSTHDNVWSSTSSVMAELTVTAILAALLGQPSTVTITAYVPLFALVAGSMINVLLLLEIAAPLNVQLLSLIHISEPTRPY